MNPEALLRFEDIHFRYPGADQVCLDGVSFAVPRGEALGLLGPNGAGKTTLISLAMGLLPLQRGRITLEGQPMTAARGQAPQLVSLVPQDLAFYPVLTVRENLRFFGQVQNLGTAFLRQRIDHALAFTQLEAFADRRAGQLSGGLKRRLNLAIGLLADPTLLLLDEPTVGVDPQSRHFLLEAIGQLQREGRTIVYTSHYMDEIEALCSHVAILDQGRLLIAGTIGEVLASAPPVISLRLLEPMPEALRAEWTERYGVDSLPGNRYRLSGTRMEDAPGILAQAQAAGAVVDAWSWGQQHLDDVFMQFTHHALRDE